MIKIYLSTYDCCVKRQFLSRNAGLLPRMIHTTLLVFAISVYICSVAFLYLKDFLPACNGILTTVHFTLQMINSIFFQPTTMSHGRLNYFPNSIRDRKHSAFRVLKVSLLYVVLCRYRSWYMEHLFTVLMYLDIYFIKLAKS